jgi:hypothetical protein
MTAEYTLHTATFRQGNMTPMPTAYGYAQVEVMCNGRARTHAMRQWLHEHFISKGLDAKFFHICEPQYYRRWGRNGEIYKAKVNFKDHQAFVMAKIHLTTGGF